MMDDDLRPGDLVHRGVECLLVLSTQGHGKMMTWFSTAHGIINVFEFDRCYEFYEMPINNNVNKEDWNFIDLVHKWETDLIKAEIVT